MNVGMLRASKYPGILARAIAYVCSNHGIPFFYFTPEDVDIERRKIHGKFMEEGKWVTKETDFPDVIDNVPMRSKDQQLYKELEKTGFLVTKRIGSKQEVFKMLETDGRFDDVLIPYKKAEKIDDIYTFMEAHPTILLKPSISNQGRDIYTLQREGEKLLLGTDNTLRELTENEFQEVYETIFARRLFLCQPFIDSKTNEGFPFDVRIHTRKNEHGNWQAVKIYPRLGIGKAITSNISQGGGISPINSFLKSQFGERWVEVKRSLDKQSATFPEKFQSLYDYSIDALGIDFGIDKTGKLWLFEVNTFPGARFFFAEDAEARIKYYKYCANTFLVN